MHQERRWYPIDVLARALRMSRGGYYNWLRGLGQRRAHADEVLLTDIRRVYADNERAIALYRKFGFEAEGTHRAYALRDGRYVDALAMARLRPKAA